MLGVFPVKNSVDKTALLDRSGPLVVKNVFKENGVKIQKSNNWTPLQEIRSVFLQAPISCQFKI